MMLKNDIESLKSNYQRIYDLSGEIFDLINEAHEICNDLNDKIKIDHEISDEATEALFSSMASSSLYLKNSSLSMKIKLILSEKTLIKLGYN